MNLSEKILSDMNDAQRKSDKSRLATIRFIRAEIKNKEIEARHALSDVEIQHVLQQLARQRRETIQIYQPANRPDLVEKEEAELAIVESYLPKQLTDGELSELIDETIAELKTESGMNLGHVMKAVMVKVSGKADGQRINALLRAKIGGSSR